MKGTFYIDKVTRRKDLHGLGPSNTDLDARSSEMDFEAPSSFPDNNQSPVINIPDRRDLRMEKMLSRSQQPIREKILRDKKPVDLHYDANTEVGKKKIVSQVL